MNFRNAIRYIFTVLSSPVLSHTHTFILIAIAIFYCFSFSFVLFFFSVFLRQKLHFMFQLHSLSHVFGYETINVCLHIQCACIWRFSLVNTKHKSFCSSLSLFYFWNRTVVYFINWFELNATQKVCYVCTTLFFKQLFLLLHWIFSEKKSTRNCFYFFPMFFARFH